ncbi:hypothetical protein ACOCG7_06855 [Paraburkholderia sp. DD10]|jgi:hypothetical protein|uniref:Uncharacterized protein n=1 Tax=Paraburkholderia terricola TaxID=169427 RepID=A0A1M6TLH6_9BURK|nr:MULTISPECIES: hypothetical protein [Paraburkholderia]SDO79919.1 hypothetical protein SAMN05192547_102811 [Paraburkholderia sediminicola]SHK57855.1 hypothetical protein SAMN05192548_102811 [Paraburkholderia terricola]
MKRANRRPGVQLPLILESDPVWCESLLGARRDELIAALADLLLEALGKERNEQAQHDQGGPNEPEDHV